MKYIHSAFFLLLVVLLSSSAQAVVAKKPAAIHSPSLEKDAPKRPEELSLLTTGTIKDVLKPDLLLMDDEKRYRLDNIIVPVEYTQTALDALKSEFAGRKVKVYSYSSDSPPQDRYGLPLCHIVRDDGLWVQEDLVLKGLTMVSNSMASWKMTAALAKDEAAARGQKVGLWANPKYAVRSPLDVGNYINSFQIIEGTIMDVAATDNTIFFNFGADWKTDFTIKTLKSTWSGFYPKDNGSSAAAWKGHRVRVRGWVEQDNGPMIEMTTADQIEILD